MIGIYILNKVKNSYFNLNYKLNLIYFNNYI